MIHEKREGDIQLKNLFSINKATTLVIGRLAGLSVFVALVMIFVTPLMASPAMCGLPNNEAQYLKVITGFTLTNGIYTFETAPAHTPIMMGTWLAVTDKKTGKEVPVALEQPLTLRGNGAYHSNAPAIPAPSLAQNSELISGIPSANIAPICKTDAMCKTTSTKLPATFVKIVNGFTFDPTTKTYTFTEAPNFPLSLGSFVDVIVNGKEVPASIAKFRWEQIFMPDKKDPSKIHMGGFLYIHPDAGDSTDQAQRLDITITKTQMNAITHSIQATGAPTGTGWS